MDWGDVPTWVTAGVAVLVAADARWRVRQNTDQRAAMAQSMERIADALEANATRPPGEEPASIAWLIENPKKNTFVLRNLGGQTATGVHVTTDHPAALARDLPAGVDIPPLGSARFVLLTAWGQPTPDEVQVSCNGGPRQSVPVPRWF